MVIDLIEQFNALYRDVKRGDRYLLEYHFDGVALSLNGDFLGSVGGGSRHEKELAQAIYSQSTNRMCLLNEYLFWRAVFGSGSIHSLSGLRKNY
ncbi:hypothetical protein HJC23_010868 [Cyclotella cryptica]|uniref:Uncharacterized protein n=1 Tax=Cyclotella cryptica TaxID=29204 RepID=A0ABD3QPJ4_9STRA